MRLISMTSLVLCAALLTPATGVALSPGSDNESPMTPKPGRILKDVPRRPDPGALYLIYLHGRIVETDGERPTHPDFGVYEYREILETFAEMGFTVISEIRPETTHPDAFSRRIWTQVKALLDNGVPAGNITVVGFSKGGVIAALTTKRIADPNVNWVILAGCGEWLEKVLDLVANGRILSILDRADTNATSCEPLFAMSPEGSVHHEIILDLGTGHGAFYTPDPAWVEPTAEWAGR